MPSRTVSSTLQAILMDVACALVAIGVALWLRDRLPFGQTISDTALVSPMVFVLVVLISSASLFIFSVYEKMRLSDELRAVIIANLFMLLCLAGALYFTYRITSRLLIVYFCVLNLLALIGWRLVASAARRKIFKPQTMQVLIVGANDLGRSALEAIQRHAGAYLTVAGFIDNAEPGTVSTNEKVLGTFTQIRDVVIAYKIDSVIFTLPYSGYEPLSEMILALQDLPVQVRIVPNYLNLVLYRSTVEEFGGLQLINVRALALSKYQRLVKRVFDLLVGSLLCILSLPAMALVALVIRLDSPGPVIFRQRRVGENGCLFTMYKFRSMYEQASMPADPLDTGAALVDTPLLSKTLDDPRVTRIGRFIRRTSLDELPQFFNVIKGEMSLVGPRPEMPELVRAYQRWQRQRFAIPQGLTGWWQVNGRSDRPMQQHTEDDLYYIQHYSLLLDLIILWRTLFVVLRRRGAY